LWRCNPMREKLPFNRSLDRYLIGLLRLSLGVTLGNACYNMSKNLICQTCFLSSYSVVGFVTPF
jgi:hypothetical protein